MKIITNYHVRDTIDGSQLSPDERAEFDYIDWPAVERGEDSATFVRYKGDLIDLGDVLVAPDDLRALGWDGFNSDSFFSGLAFRYFDRDGYEIQDGVVIALVLA